MFQLIVTLVLFFFSIVIHECAHGWVANRLGDPTARLAGRLTLNPLAHIDPVGTILLPLALAAVGSPIMFGWARPVPINVFFLKMPRRDIIWVTLAGPAANIGFAILLAGVFHLAPLTLHPFLAQIIVINLLLGLFNLIPIPPLDGSRILFAVMPRRLASGLARIEPYGLLLVLIGVGIGAVQRIIWPVVIWWLHVLGVGLP